MTFVFFLPPMFILGIIVFLTFVKISISLIYNFYFHNQYHDWLRLYSNKNDALLVKFAWPLSQRPVASKLLKLKTWNGRVSYLENSLIITVEKKLRHFYKHKTAVEKKKFEHLIDSAIVDMCFKIVLNILTCNFYFDLPIAIY